MNNQKRKVSVTREELVAITGDNIAAQILNQLIYWSSKGSGEWIYKGAQELADEIMSGSKYTVLRRLEQLKDAGFIVSRKNPDPIKCWLL